MGNRNCRPRPSKTAYTKVGCPPDAAPPPAHAEDADAEDDDAEDDDDTAPTSRTLEREARMAADLFAALKFAAQAQYNGTYFTGILVGPSIPALQAGAAVEAVATVRASLNDPTAAKCIGDVKNVNPKLLPGAYALYKTLRDTGHSPTAILNSILRAVVY